MHQMRTIDYLHQPDKFELLIEFFIEEEKSMSALGNVTVMTVPLEEKYNL
jgi:hypothetical protein